MKTGICPKCQARTVHVKNEAIITNSGATVIIVGMFARAHLRTYVCTTCGYVEQYVIEADALPKIARDWPKAGD